MTKTVFVVCAAVLASATPVVAQPAPEPALPPPADFQSTGRQQWEVLVDQQPVCVTPCTFGVPRGRWVTMRTVESRPVRVEVGMLGDAPVQVRAKPHNNGAYVTGITFTTLGGMALVTGIVFTAVGCSADDREGMCTAGLITGGAGAVVTAGSIWLMTRAVPRVQVRRGYVVGAAPLPGGAGATLAGRF